MSTTIYLEHRSMALLRAYDDAVALASSSDPKTHAIGKKLCAELETVGHSLEREYRAHGL
jgi:hypothetical protein